MPSDTIDIDNDGDMMEPLPLDLDGLPRFVDDPKTRDTGLPGNMGLPIVDIGAYEFQAAGLLADLNRDRQVDGSDLGLLLGEWGTPDDNADLNNDGIVNGSDLGLLLGSWSLLP